ncbi:hypothetical protein AGMMS49921_02220 [Endomicrobiia bacterium]|nr:hypothetical protein AGMMS49921_02220 [Endomicrobiia bacterium]
MGVKKAFDKRAKDSKERREEKEDRRSKADTGLTELKNKIHTNTLTLKKEIKEASLTKEDKKLNREISSDDYSGKCQSIC